MRQRDNTHITLLSNSIVAYENILLKIVEGTCTCKGCYFKLSNDGCSRNAYKRKVVGACLHGYRNIIFKKIK